MAVAVLATSAAAQDAVPPTISAQLDRLRQDWPEVPRAEMRDGRRFEFSGGTIKIGSVTLAELEAAPENDHGVVLVFLLGHEAWHAVQAARRSAAELDVMRRNRMRECESDFMGGAAAYRFLAANGLDEQSLERAHHRLTAYVRNKTALAGPANSYPRPEKRVEAVAIGWGQARSAELIRYEGRDAVPANEGDRATDICRKIVEVSDKSVGMVDVRWPIDRPPVSGDTETLSGTVANQSGRAIVANFLVPAWLYHYPPYTPGEPVTREPLEPVAFDVLDARIDLAPNETKSVSFTVRRYVDPADRDPDASRKGSYADRFPSFSSGYAEARGPRVYCMSQIGTAALIADRTLLARIAAIAVAADDDFEAVASDMGSDHSYGQQKELIRALDPNGEGFISISSISATAQLALFRGAIDEAAAEYARLKLLLETVCGADRAKEQQMRPDADPSQRMLMMEAFAPKARVTIQLWPNRSGQPIEGGATEKQGTVAVVILRDPQQ